MKRKPKPKVNKRYAKFGKIAKPRKCKCGATLRFEDHSSVGGPKKYWVCDTCGQEMFMFGTGSPKSKLIPVKLDQRVIELERSKTFDESDVGIWQRLWRDKSIRRLMLVMAGLLLLIVVAIVMSAGGDDEVVNERVDEVHPVVQEAQTVATDVDGVVADGLGGAGQFIAQWMDLIVLLMVLGFILSVFTKIGGMFK